MTADTLAWLDSLDALAAAATPGERDFDPGRPYNSGLDPIDEGEWPSFSLPSPDPNSGRDWWRHSVFSDSPEADAAYIAALDPATIRRLVSLARLGAAGLDIELLTKVFEGLDTGGDGEYTYTFAIDSLGAFAAEVAREYAALRAELEGRT